MGIEITAGTVIAAAVSAAASAGSAIYATNQSKAAAKYANQQKKAAYEKGVAVNRANAQISNLEKQRMLQDRYEQIQGAMKVSGSERNVLGGRTSFALNNSLGIQAARESAKASMESRLGIQSYGISNAPQWMLGQSQSAFLGGIQGGLQGLQLGLQMQGASDSLANTTSLSGYAPSVPTYAQYGTGT